MALVLSEPNIQDSKRKRHSGTARPFFLLVGTLWSWPKIVKREIQQKRYERLDVSQNENNVLPRSFLSFSLMTRASPAHYCSRRR